VNVISIPTQIHYIVTSSSHPETTKLGVKSYPQPRSSMYSIYSIQLKPQNTHVTCTNSPSPNFYCRILITLDPIILPLYSLNPSQPSSDSSTCLTWRLSEWKPAAGVHRRDLSRGFDKTLSLLSPPPLPRRLRSVLIVR